MTSKRTTSACCVFTYIKIKIKKDVSRNASVPNALSRADLVLCETIREILTADLSRESMTNSSRVSSARCALCTNRVQGGKKNIFLFEYCANYCCVACHQLTDEGWGYLRSEATVSRRGFQHASGNAACVVCENDRTRHWDLIFWGNLFILSKLSVFIQLCLALDG